MDDPNVLNGAAEKFKTSEKTVCDEYFLGVFKDEAPGSMAYVHIALSVNGSDRIFVAELTPSDVLNLTRGLIDSLIISQQINLKAMQSLSGFVDASNPI